VCDYCDYYDYYDRQNYCPYMHVDTEEAERRKIAGIPLPWGTISRIAREYGFSRPAVSKLWSQTCANISIGIPVPKAMAYRPKVYIAEECVEHVMQVPLQERSTIRDLAQHLGMSHSTLHNMIKEKNSLFSSHTSSLKPVITEAGEAASFFLISFSS
jgi:transposase-like protein